MHILIFGDSITQGFFDLEHGGWANRLLVEGMQKSVDAEHEKGFDVFNLGISGDCTNRLLKRFDAEASARTKEGTEPAMFMFAIGVNDTQRYVATGDLKTPAEQFKNNLTALYEKARAYTDTVVFVGLTPIIEDMVNPMPWADDRGHTDADVLAYDEILKELCDKKECLYVPMRDVFQDVALSDVLIDGVHPNAKGHQLIYERVKEVCEKEGLL